MRAADAGMVYASHAFLPFNLPGYATCAYEIYEQLGREPGAIIVPAGQGGFLLGIARGFEALLCADKIQKMPMMIGAQALACAPLYALWKNGTMNDVVESLTIAEGVPHALAGSCRSCRGDYASKRGPLCIGGRSVYLIRA